MGFLGLHLLGRLMKLSVLLSLVLSALAMPLQSMAATECRYNGTAPYTFLGWTVFYNGSLGERTIIWWDGVNVYLGGGQQTSVQAGGHTYTMGDYVGETEDSVATNATFYVCRESSNQPPSVGNVGLTAQEDTSASITLTASDPDAGDYHSFRIVSSPSASAGSAVISGATLTFTPKANWNGTTSLTYQATDSKGVVSNVATVTITITPVNDPPIALPLSLTVDEDAVGSVALGATDIDSPIPTIFQIVTAPNPAYGSAVISGGSLIFTPAANWNGTTSLTYRAQDNSGAWSTPAVLTITVRAINDPPTVVNRVLSLMEDSQAVLLLSAIDVDSSTFTYELVAQPVVGSVSISGAQLSYTPPQDWSGDTSLTYRARDDSGAWSNVATVNITVSPVNDPPVAMPLSLVIDEDTRGVVTLLATDIDSAQSFEYELVGLPGGAVDVSIEGDQLAVKPFLNWSGSVSVGYRAKDQGGEWSSTALVAVTVRPVNDAPVIYLPMRIKSRESESVSVKGRVQ